jgi:hypothetical protein
VTGSGCCASTTAGAAATAAAGSCCCNSTGCSWGRAACSSGCGCAAGSPCACCASWLARSLFFFSLFSLRSLFFSFRLEKLKGQFHKIVDLFFSGPCLPQSVFRILENLCGSKGHFLCNIKIWCQTEAIAILKFNISFITFQGSLASSQPSKKKF